MTNHVIILHFLHNLCHFFEIFSCFEALSKAASGGDISRSSCEPLDFATADSFAPMAKAKPHTIYCSVCICATITIVWETRYDNSKK
jgi:hypothetical protein